MKALVVSFFSSENLGDLLISDEISRMAAGHAQVVKLNYGPAPRQVTDLNGLRPRPERPSPRQGSMVRDLTHTAAFALGGDRLVDRLRPGQAAGDRALSKLKNEVEASMYECDVLVIGGGNMLFDISRRSKSWEYFELYVETARRQSRPVFGISIGAGPFATRHQANRAASVAGRCNVLTVRDRGSLRALTHGAPGLRAMVVPDPVFGLPRVRGPVARPRRVAVNALDVRLAGASRSASREAFLGFSSLIQQISRVSGDTVTLFSTDMQDYPFLREIYRCLGSSVCDVYEVTGLRSLMAMYEDTSVVVASRMHSMITAFTQGIPVVGIEWQPKIRGFFETISDVESCFGLKHAASSKSPLVARVRDILHDVAGESARVEQRLVEVRARLSRNEELLRCLALGAADPDGDGRPPSSSCPSQEVD